MQIAVSIPEKMAQLLSAPYDKSINEILAVELYREGTLTLRQAAEIRDVGLAEMSAVLTRRKTYINYGEQELNDDISYARS
jgi:predicted HTH domain antitoxin